MTDTLDFDIKAAAETERMLIEEGATDRIKDASMKETKGQFDGGRMDRWGAMMLCLRAAADCAMDVAKEAKSVETRALILMLMKDSFKKTAGSIFGGQFKARAEDLGLAEYLKGGDK
jgi:hypothetical protein